MNYPPIFQTITADPEAVAMLTDSDITRLYPAGEAPADTLRPYATWQMISGLPENYLGTRPDIDQYTVQIDVWADTLASVRETAGAIRGAVEMDSYVVGYRAEERQDDTDLYRVSFDLDWFVHRD